MSDIPMQEFGVARDVDRLDEHLGNSISDFFFKVSTEDCHGTLLVIELTNRTKGDVPRHIHYEQDEWFYVVEGEYIIEVGQARFRLKPGDSVFGPRNVPHVWAFMGDQPGRILSVITPAGRVEEFFRGTGKTHAPPPLDPALFHAYGFELVGPPLAIE
jgi:mannose-6-phosphate isomerase-like protein (cupin superfamily)